MCHALHVLAAATMDEAVELCRHAPKPTQAALRNVPFKREIYYSIGNVDSSSFADYFLGLPTVRWTLQAPTRVTREHCPVSAVQLLFANAHDHNKRLISHGRHLILSRMWKHVPELPNKLPLTL